MNLQELIDVFVQIVDDTVAPYLWSDDEIIRYLNEAQIEAVIRSKSLKEKWPIIASPRKWRFQLPRNFQDIFRLVPVYQGAFPESMSGQDGWPPLGLDFDPGCASVPEPPPWTSPFPTPVPEPECMINDEVPEAPPIGEVAYYRRRPLSFTDIQYLDMTFPEWQTQIGYPDSYFIEQNGANYEMQLVPRPVIPISLEFEYFRLPEPIGDEGPEIPSEDHRRMVDWAVRCAYLKRGLETFNVNLSKVYEDKFTESFGIRQDADVRRQQRRHRPPVCFMDRAV